MRPPTSGPGTWTPRAGVLEYLDASADYVVGAGLPVGVAATGVRAELSGLGAPETPVPFDRQHVTLVVNPRAGRALLRQSSGPFAARQPELRPRIATASDLQLVRCAPDSAGADRGLPSLSAVVAAADRLQLEDIR